MLGLIRQNLSYRRLSQLAVPLLKSDYCGKTAKVSLFIGSAQAGSVPVDLVQLDSVLSYFRSSRCL